MPSLQRQPTGLHFSIIVDFRLSPVTSFIFNSAVGNVHHVDVGDVTDVSIYMFPPSSEMKSL
jgi:hypothetical protein